VSGVSTEERVLEGTSDEGVIPAEERVPDGTSDEGRTLDGMG
jgi:hypothetical protein